MVPSFASLLFLSIKLIPFPFSDALPLFFFSLLSTLSFFTNLVLHMWSLYFGACKLGLVSFSYWGQKQIKLYFFFFFFIFYFLKLFKVAISRVCDASLCGTNMTKLPEFKIIDLIWLWVSIPTFISRIFQCLSIDFFNHQ